jgi:hypothetical protein
MHFLEEGILFLIWIMIITLLIMLFKRKSSKILDDGVLEAPKMKKMKNNKVADESDMVKDPSKKPNLVIEIPNSSFSNCKCRKGKCRCGFRTFINHYEDRINQNLNEEILKYRCKYGSSNVRHILGYRYAGEYEGNIVDYYYENEAKPIHLRKNCLPFDLLTEYQFERILRIVQSSS